MGIDVLRCFIDNKKMVCFVLRPSYHTIVTIFFHWLIQCLFLIPIIKSKIFIQAYPKMILLSAKPKCVHYYMSGGMTALIHVEILDIHRNIPNWLSIGPTENDDNTKHQLLHDKTIAKYDQHDDGQ